MTARRPGRLAAALAEIPGPIRALYLADLLFGAAYAADRLLGRPVTTVSLWLDLDRGGSLPSWFLSLQFAAAAGLLAAFALRRPRSPRGEQAWLWLPVLTLALVSADVVVQMHDDLGRVLNRLLWDLDHRWPPFGFWGAARLAVGLPFLAAVLALLWRARRHHAASPGASPLLLTGLGLFVLGAAGFDALVNIVAPGFGAYTLTVLGGELLEMAGATTMVWAGLLLVRASARPAPPH